MPRSNRSVVILAAVATILVLVGAVGYLVGGDDAAQARVYLPNSGGGVLFDHASHGAQVGACATCHHTLVQGGGPGACVACHDDGDVSPDDMEHAELLEIHADAELSCADCHGLADDENAGNCRACHGREAHVPASGSGCVACHDDAPDRDVFESHGEMVALHVDADVGCADCHTVRAIADAYHTQCSACHLAVHPDIFADTDGRARCGRCHLP